ncbi:MAG: M3 family oligoendopeptidase [Chloroflexota bacterium]|nr:M3 family oligoendopeptidase [Chloroflexota bacterium]
MITTERVSPERFRDATWDQIRPLFDALAGAPLDRDRVDAWVTEWSDLEDAISEAMTLVSIANSVDTTDTAAEEAYLRFATDIWPKVEEQRVRLSSRLLDIDPDRDDLQVTLRSFRNQRDLFRAENVAIKGQLEELGSEYQKLTGGMTATWDGEELPLPRLLPFLEEPDREVRERAFRLVGEPYVRARDEIATIFDRQIALRQEMARNAGLENYRDYAFREFDRFDYGPVECEAFHAAMERHVVPAAARRLASRRELLGVETMRPWDVDPDPRGRPALRPFTGGQDLIDRLVPVFDRVDPVLGGYFRTMRDESLLDLDSRAGKAPGGYCTDLPVRQRPFIFMNAAGTTGDVETMLHEAGHAFHSFESFHLPFAFHRFPGSEMAEVGSMAMELLAAPYLGQDEGGPYATADLARARVTQLEGIMVTMPWIAVVDAFQHWVYTDPDGADRDARDEAWVRIFERFNPGVDWSGLESFRLARWYRQLHIFQYPFYYIEYGLAQLGALQVWRNAMRDQAAAVAAYREALALGATKPLPDLFAAAGANFTVDAGEVGDLVTMIEGELARLDALDA